MTFNRARMGAALALLLLLAGGIAARATNPSALWHIVHDRCVPNEQQTGHPAPCALVDLSQGVARGYVVLKDLVGATQYLVLPTARITGIESPLLLKPEVPNYMAHAWAARRFVDARAKMTLPRQDLSLALNSVFGRSQNQLHIHVDCVRADVRNAIATHLGALGASWTPFPVSLVGQSWMARRVASSDLQGVDPFRLLAAVASQTRGGMGWWTLVAVGASLDGRPGFVLLAERADPARHNFASGEDLQDHACAVLREISPRRSHTPPAG